MTNYIYLYLKKRFPDVLETCISYLRKSFRTGNYTELAAIQAMTKVVVDLTSCLFSDLQFSALQRDFFEAAISEVDYKRIAIAYFLGCDINDI